MTKEEIETSAKGKLEDNPELYEDWREKAEAIIKKESDGLAKVSGLRTKWDDQHIEVQYMITGSMIDFAELYAFGLQSKNERLKAEREWIGVNDRLPELCVWSLFITSDGKCVVDMVLADPFSERFLKSQYTHWMPLPQSPKQ